MWHRSISPNATCNYISTEKKGVHSKDFFPDFVITLLQQMLVKAVVKYFIILKYDMYIINI